MVVGVCREIVSAEKIRITNDYGNVVSMGLSLYLKERSEGRYIEEE
jgi:hypothetical protein